MPLPDLLASQDWIGWRYLSPLVLLWLAFLFGRTLRSGSTPLIERIARRSSPSLSASLCHYTRWLTAIWCGYFVGAAALSAIIGWSGAVDYSRLGLVVLVGSVLLFVGEYWLRRRIFPQEVFPNLLQQLRDTWSIWRTPDGAHPDTRR